MSQQPWKMELGVNMFTTSKNVLERCTANPGTDTKRDSVKGRSTQAPWSFLPTAAQEPPQKSGAIMATWRASQGHGSQGNFHSKDTILGS